jgi:hypothetical protein
MFGSMYISYRKAYITGMNPLTFLTWFTFGEIVTVTLLAIASLGGVGLFWQALLANRSILLWPMLGGFMWVVGDLFQNYAAKYVGISRGIPLSNTNQLWGLLWAVLVFHELHGLTAHVYAEVIGGSVIMVLGSLAIASSSASGKEYASWQKAAQRETDLYHIDPEYVASRGEGRELTVEGSGRTWGDWLLISAATLIFVGLGVIARVPHMEIQMGWLFALTAAMLVMLIGGCIALWRVTRFI